MKATFVSGTLILGAIAVGSLVWGAGGPGAAERALLR